MNHAAPACADPERRALLGAGALALAGCRATSPSASSPPSDSAPSAPTAAPTIPAPAASSSRPVPLADAHSHYGWFSPAKIRRGEDLGPRLREAGVALLAWSVTSDGPWIRLGAQRIEQVAVPPPGALETHFFESIARARQFVQRAGVTLALEPADIDRAVDGTPAIVLAAEAADFLEGSLDGLARAHALGLRHTQLVHYLRSNPVGDLQTAPPAHGGLSAFGRSLVRACNREGILVDLAHCSRDTVDAALDVADVAPVWSHSAIAQDDEHWSQPGGRARRLHVSRARSIAARGGAIGLWALGASTGRTPDAYADSLLRAADLVGPAHVMIGSDTDGLGRGSAASIEAPADLRRVADALQARRTDDATVRALCFGNYARCLRGAMMRRSNRNVGAAGVWQSAVRV